MHDCQNAAIRDQLPELLHDRLDTAARTVVLAHVDGCGDCQSEIELLRGLQGMLIARTPRVDVQYVIGALPLAARRSSIRPAVRHRTWADWRIAAAVTFLAVGGGSVAVLHHAASPIVPPALTTGSNRTTANAAAAAGQGAPATPMPASPSSASTAANAVASANTAASGISMSGRLDDLSDDQLQALLDQVGDLQAIPITEPDPVAIQVGSTNGAAPEGA